MRMKKTTPRKRSSSERININRFWNEMEEFRDKLGNEKAVKTTHDFDREVETVFSSMQTTKDTSEGEDKEDDDDLDDDLSCYCSGSSCYFSRSVSVSSNYSSQVNLSQDTDHERLSPTFLNIPFHHPYSIIPLPPGSDHKHPLLPSPSPENLPLPPSIQSTKAMLDLMARLKISKLNTLV